MRFCRQVEDTPAVPRRRCYQRRVPDVAPDEALLAFGPALMVPDEPPGGFPGGTRPPTVEEMDVMAQAACPRGVYGGTFDVGRIANLFEVV